MRLQLNRPLNFLDVESTGLDVQKDRIISLAIVTIEPDGFERHATWLFNPGVPILNSEIHGITDEIVKDCPRFEQEAGDIYGCLLQGDVAGFNLQNFDLQIIWQELWRCGIEWDLSDTKIIDAGLIFKKKEPRDLTAAVKFYCGKEHTDAHGAMPDAIATMEVIDAQVGRYTDLPSDVEGLHEFTNVDDRDGSRRLDLAGTIKLNKDGVPVFGTKRNKDVPVEHDLGYASWILRSDFPAQTLKVLRQVVDDIQQVAASGGQSDMF